ncbi:MAG: PorV/PorQ family protein [bacterium]
MRKIWLFLLLWLIFSQNVEAEKTHALVVLKFPMSAKIVGMGETSVGIPDGINSIFSNPAGLSVINYKEFIASYSSFVDTNYGWLGYAQRINSGSVFSLSLITLQAGNMEINYLNNESKKVKAESDYVIILSNGFMVNKRLSLGINLKAIQSELAEEVKTKAHALDLGTLLLVSENMNLGAGIQNLGSKVKYKEKEDTLPFNIRVGGGYRFSLPYENEVTLGIDLIKPKNESKKVNVGLEYAGIERELIDNNLRLYLRVGYEIGYDTKGITLGIGFVERRFQLDYAYLPRNDLGNSHYISFKIKFDE